MNHALGLLPSGKLRCFVVDDRALQNEIKVSAVADISGLFLAKKTSEGLFALAALAFELTLPPTFRFWSEFSCLYMTDRCAVFQENSASANAHSLVPIEALGSEAAEQLLNSLPPMKGAEYLTVSVLQDIWRELDEWLCQEVEQSADSLAALLKIRAPRWHQTGRVCFHLAENKNDSNYPFAFMATYSPAYGQAQGKSRHLPLAKAMEEYAGKQNKAALIHLLSPIDLASRSSGLIKALLDSGEIYHPLAWTPKEAYQFLQEVPLFEQSGIVTRLPNWWQKRRRPTVQVTLGASPKSTFGANAMLNFDVQLALGEEQVSAEEWERLLASDQGLVLLKGQWVEVNAEQLEEALAHMKALEKQAHNGGISFIEGMRLLAGNSADLSASNHDQTDIKWTSIKADDALAAILREIREPENRLSALPKRALKATLRPYQEVGVNWLWTLNQLGLGACLADDMGLGKTLQIISLWLIFKKKNISAPSLLVLPTSLLGNWQAELARFAPSIKVVFAHPSMRHKKQLAQLSAKDGLAGVDVVVTTYGMLQRQTWLQEQTWHTVVLDEAQAIKNPAAQQTRVVKSLTAHTKIVLTGTPVENSLRDLWSLFDFICPGLLGSAKRFKSYTESLQERPSEPYAPLRKLVQPYILRRMKTDKSIISDLPDKTEVYAYCGLVKEQAVLYQQAVDELAESLKTQDGIKRRGLVLAFIMRFKQICNHPAQYLSDGNFLPSHSGKFLRLAEICEAISKRQEKVIVFTQYRTMCEPLADFLADCFNQQGLILHGGVPAKKRQQRVADFQREEGPPFFVLSLKAGGSGLTLTEASHVIHFDRWWNPAVENQATDRAFRIGQKKNVLIHKFVCRGTIEEKIDEMISEKSALASDLLDGSQEIKLTEMNDQELIDLVSLDLERAKA